MNTETLMPLTEGAIWARIVDPETGDLTRQAAHTLLRLDFAFADRERMEELADKASAGKLGRRDQKDAAAYNRVAHLLALLQSKARLSLRGKNGR